MSLKLALLFFMIAFFLGILLGLAIARALPKYLIVSRKKVENAYVKKTYIMTASEYEVFRRVERILQNTKYLILPQVATRSIVNKTNGYRDYELNTIVDSRICTRNGYSPVLVIELNDNSHNEKERRERDEKQKAIFKSANMPLITLWTNLENNPAYIKERIEKILLDI